MLYKQKHIDDYSNDILLLLPLYYLQKKLFRFYHNHEIELRSIILCQENTYLLFHSVLQELEHGVNYAGQTYTFLPISFENF